MKIGLERGAEISGIVINISRVALYIGCLTIPYSPVSITF